MGLGYVMAAERLGLEYLDGPKPILNLLVDFGNKACAVNMKCYPSEGEGRKALGRTADELATILKGRNPSYMATTWFTDPKLLRAHLRRKLEEGWASDAPAAVRHKDPIIEFSRYFVEFFIDLTEGAVAGQGQIPNERLAAEFIRKCAGAICDIDPAMLPLELGFGPPETRPVKIVAVDDEPFVLDILKRLFQHAPKDVVLKTFTKSDEAWQALMQEDPDLLITDDQMPCLKGEAICRRLLERKVTYPILVISSWPPTDEWVREYASRGLNITYLASPFRVADFRKALGPFGNYVAIAEQDAGDSEPQSASR